MKSSITNVAPKSRIIRKIKDVDQLFIYLDNHKKLPKFSDFFVECVLLGEAESVNLRKKYPFAYSKIRKVIEEMKP
jgi:hypothetical protein